MIAAFVADKMSLYIAGGMDLLSAASFTRNELEAIYTDNHRGLDATGAFRITPPEALDPETAMKKCDAVIDELLKICAEGAGKGQLLNTETRKAETHGTAPESPPKAQETESGANKSALAGWEKLAEYAGREMA